MVGGHLDITSGERRALQNVARDLHLEFRGIFGEETIESLVFDSYEDLLLTSTVLRWLVIGAERFARQRLQALAHAGAPEAGRVPGVLFLCVHNASRSQMALGWFSHLAGNRAMAWSGGSHPVAPVNPAAVSAMAEVGIDISREFPKPWVDEFLTAADVVITMGCGDACPLLPGKQYEDWELDDPSGMSVDEIRVVRDEIRLRVVDLMDRLSPVRADKAAHRWEGGSPPAVAAPD